MEGGVARLCGGDWTEDEEGELSGCLWEGLWCSSSGNSRVWGEGMRDLRFGGVGALEVWYRERLEWPTCFPWCVCEREREREKKKKKKKRRRKRKKNVGGGKGKER
jgi:hypothetical protein